MRSPAFERAWLESVARAAGRHGEVVERFGDEVRERLELGAGEYGEDAWVEREPLETIREAAEEGVDVPAWLMLGAQKLNMQSAAGEIDPDSALEIQQRFIRAAALGMLLHEELQEAARVYKVARAEARWRKAVARVEARWRKAA